MSKVGDVWVYFNDQEESYGIHYSLNVLGAFCYTWSIQLMTSQV
jgi:hypothetical protein